MSERHYFEPKDIPREITVTLYLLYGVGHYNRGRMSVSDYWNKDPEPKRKNKYERASEQILLAEFQVTIDIPEGVDPTKRYLQVLKNERRKLLAQHHVELQTIDYRIQRVTALEHKPIGG